MRNRSTEERDQPRLGIIEEDSLEEESAARSLKGRMEVNQMKREQGYSRQTECSLECMLQSKEANTISECLRSCRWLEYPVTVGC